LYAENKNDENQRTNHYFKGVWAANEYEGRFLFRRPRTTKQDDETGIFSSQTRNAEKKKEKSIFFWDPFFSRV